MHEDGTSGTRIGDQKDKAVTISAPPEAPIVIDPQNPLPEPSFLHRRIIAYIITISVLALMAHSLEALHLMNAPDQLLNLSKWVLGFAALVATYYYIAPSAAELTNMIQSARIIRTGIGAAVESRQDATESGRQDRREDRLDREGRIRERAAGGLPAADSEEDAAPRGRS